ncbi:MAG: cytidine deaminase [Deltaproteobacteria bacterium]|nr:cytidine deaminase [Deltaproteobacteria bacterium]MBN2673624.1 cytidine deaminase [Deltaproteobacteria bacterium]
MIEWQKLKEAAIAVRKNAWAPYSKFRVGAALSVADGSIFTGCNVENVSYPVGMCAERSAVAAMVAAGYQTPNALVIAAGPLITPCGMCRQALAEFAADLPVLLVSVDSGEQQETQLATLLPSVFSF